jgi:hypothetical protein
MTCHITDEIENYCWLQHRKLLDEQYLKEMFLECDTVKEYMQNGIMKDAEADQLYAKIVRFCDPQSVNWDDTVTVYVTEREAEKFS